MIRTITFLLICMIGHPVSADELPQQVAYLAVADGYWQVWVMMPDGSRKQQVTRSPYDKNRVSWYPDGKSLLVNGNQGELVRIDIATSQEIILSSELKGMNDAVLSPDGSKIAFSLSTSGSIDDNNIWLMDSDGRNELKLTNMQGLQHEPVWSPDGKYLYFLSGRGAQAHDIWRLTLATRGTEQLTLATLYHFEPAVASDGTLAYAGNRSGNYEIWLRTPEGDEYQVTNHPGNDGKPAWSPDGRSLIFESTRSGRPELWKIDQFRCKAVQLTDHAQGARAPVWYRPAVKEST